MSRLFITIVGSLKILHFSISLLSAKKESERERERLLFTARIHRPIYYICRRRRITTYCVYHTIMYPSINDICSQCTQLFICCTRFFVVFFVSACSQCVIVSGAVTTHFMLFEHMPKRQKSEHGPTPNRCRKRRNAEQKN